jgi:hypothetical protein
MNEVRYYETVNDANYNNKYMVVSAGEVEVGFMAFPLQSYSGRHNDKSATIGKIGDKWYANTFQCLSNGKDEPLEHFETHDKIEAFIWAFEKMTGLNWRRK